MQFAEWDIEKEFREKKMRQSVQMIRHVIRYPDNDRKKVRRYN